MPKSKSLANKGDGGTTKGGKSRRPDTAASLKEKGNSLFKRGSFVDAVRYYTRAIDLDATNHIVFSNRAAAYIALGEFEAAVEDTKVCVSIDPKWAKGYFRMGVALRALDRVEESCCAFFKVLRFDPNNIELQVAMRDAHVSNRIWRMSSSECLDMLQRMKMSQYSSTFLERIFSCLSDFCVVPADSELSLSHHQRMHEKTLIGKEIALFVNDLHDFARHMDLRFFFDQPGVRDLLFGLRIAVPSIDDLLAGTAASTNQGVLEPGVVEEIMKNSRPTAAACSAAFVKGSEDSLMFAEQHEPIPTPEAPSGLATFMKIRERQSSLECSVQEEEKEGSFDDSMVMEVEKLEARERLREFFSFGGYQKIPRAESPGEEARDGSDPTSPASEASGLLSPLVGSVSPAADCLSPPVAVEGTAIDEKLRSRSSSLGRRDSDVRDRSEHHQSSRHHHSRKKEEEEGNTSVRHSVSEPSRTKKHHHHHKESNAKDPKGKRKTIVELVHPAILAPPLVSDLSAFYFSFFLLAVLERLVLSFPKVRRIALRRVIALCSERAVRLSVGRPLFECLLRCSGVEVLGQVGDPWLRSIFLVEGGLVGIGFGFKQEASLRRELVAVYETVTLAEWQDQSQMAATVSMAAFAIPQLESKGEFVSTASTVFSRIFVAADSRFDDWFGHLYERRSLMAFTRDSRKQLNEENDSLSLLQIGSLIPKKWLSLSEGEALS